MKQLLLFAFLLLSSIIYGQEYQYLGTYTSDGTPNYLEIPGDTVDASTMDLVSSSLPEGYPVPDYNPHYISSGYDTDIIVDELADVWVTFVSEGAGYKNVLGFYTYDLASPQATIPQPEDITIIFPNVSASGSGGGLYAGDKVKIGTFQPGTGIGWVLLANAWSSTTSSVGYGQWQLFSNPDFNPESEADLRYHNVLLNDPTNERIILGFEDIRRDYGSCDNDFNDAVFYVSANPYTALRTVNYADVSSSTDVTSANVGGLESNGHLAGLIAKRNFKRKQEGNQKYLKEFQSQYNSNDFTRYRNGDSTSLQSYLPETGMYGNEVPYVSSPDDLLGITNASEVFSLDMYQNDIRVSAVLATATEGSVYDHTKVICDRLNSSVLQDVRTVNVRGHQIISAKLLRASGEIEFSLSFSVKLGELTNNLYSFWDIAQYPEGDYYNFQIWGSSFSQVFAIANHILDTLTAEKALNSETLDNVVPTVFVSSGYYSNGEIVLDLINKIETTIIEFNGDLAQTETSERTNLVQTLPLTGSYHETITIETGNLFDIGFSLSVEPTLQNDTLYLADGPWGTDYLDDYASISLFEVTNDEPTSLENSYTVERQPNVIGQVKGNVNLFRHLLPGEQTLNVEEYNSISFNINSSMPVEIVLMQNDLVDWNNRYRFTLENNFSNTEHTIYFSDFVDTNGNSAEGIQDVKTIVFSVIGDYTNYVDFQLSISNVSFNIEQTLSLENPTTINNKLRNYPNPFSLETTIIIPTVSSQAEIVVYDMTGKMVDSRTLSIENNKAKYTAHKLRTGIYKYALKTMESNNQYTGTFVVE